MADISVSAEQNIDLSVHINADSKLQQELDQTRARAEQLDAQLKSVNKTVEELSEKLESVKLAGDPQKQLEAFTETAHRSVSEFRHFVESVGMLDFARWGEGSKEFDKLYQAILNGTMTATQAISHFKAEYSTLINAGISNSSGLIDSQMLSSFADTLNSVSSSIDVVIAKITELQVNGVRAITDGQGGSGAVSTFEQVKTTIQEMADNANGAYEPLTKLINAISEYANIDNAKLFSVSQAISGLGVIGKGSYSATSVENTINLLTRLQTLTRAGAIHFNVTGLEAFSSLSVRKASLNNLATFLPTIASVDVANLERLSHVDLSNFNNLDIKKASMNNLVQMIEAVNNMRVDTSWSADLIQAVRDVSESVNNSKVDISWSNELMQLARNISNSIAQLNESMGHDRTIDLNIDKSSLQGLETILNDINNVIQHTDIPKVSGEMSEMGEVAQRVATYLGRYRDALNDAENTKVHNSLTDLGIAAKDADVISQHLSDMHIKVKSITPEWETITKIIDEEIIKEQKLKQITVQGTTALGDAVNHVIKFNAETGDISKEITRATVKGKELKQTIKELADGTKETNIETTVANLKEIDGLIKSIEKTNSSLNSSKNKVTDLLGGLSTTGKNREELDAINKKFDELTVATERLKTNRMTANQEDVDGLRKVQEELDALIRKSQERLRIESEANKKPKETKVVDFTVDGQKAEATLETIRRKLADLKEPSEEAKKSVSDLETAITAFNTATTQEDKQQALTNINKLITIANTRLSEQKIIQNKLEQANKRAETAERQAATSKEQALKRALALLKQIEQAESNWTAARKGKSKEEYSYLSTYATSLRQYVSELESGKLTVKDFVAKMNQLSVSFQGTGSVIRANGEDVKSFGERVRELGSKFSAWFGVTRIIMRIYSTLRQMVSASIEVDNAMTQLQIVTKESDQVMSKFGDTAADAAKRIGSSVTDFLSSATTFARLGYSLNESSQLAEYTAMLQNVGNIDVAQAQDAITSIVKAYSDIDINQIESVMDKLVSTGNGFPISVGQIAEGMTNASAALSAAGNSFDQSVALLTAANAATQNAAKASTGLRTIAARIRKTKTELDDLGETMETADYDKIVQQLTHFNVSLTDVNGEYRSTYDIMADIAAKWNDMTSMEQAALAEALSGNRQQQIFYSIINNFKEASGAMDAMSSSAGTLKNAYSTYMESTTAHINQFKASFQDLSSNLFKSDLLKFFIDLGTRIVNAMNGLQKVHILLPTIVAIATAIRGIGLAKRLAESTAKINVLTAATIKEKTVTESLKNSVAALTIKERERFAADIQSAVASGKLSDEEAKQILTTLGLATADGTLTVANKSLAGSFKTLMASIPVWGWIALGVSVLADAIIWLSSSVSSTSDNIRSLEESFAQTQNEMRQISDEFKNLKESADETIPRFSELAKGVDDFGKNISLTDEEYKEFLSLNNKIAEMFPQLNMGMDENGNYMLALSYSADTLRESLEQLLEVQRQEANENLAKKMPENINEVIELEKEYSRQIAEIDEQNKRLLSGKVTQKSILPGDVSDVYKFIDDLKRHGVEFQTTYSPDGSGRGVVVAVDFDPSSNAVKNFIAGNNNKKEDLKSRITSKWKTVNPSINAWLQSDYLYNDMNSRMQQVAQTMANALDFNALGLVTDNGEDTAKNIQTYITKYIINPLYSSSDEVKTAFKDSISLFESGEISETEFADRMKVAFDKLKQGMDDNEVTEFTNTFVKGFNAIGIAGDDFDSVADAIVESWGKISKAGGDSDSSGGLSIQQYSEDIKKAQDAISPLLDAYNKLQKGEMSNNDIVTLIADKFPALIAYTNDLSAGVKQLASEELDKLKSKLNEIDKSQLSEDDLSAYETFIGYIDRLNDGFSSTLAYYEKIQSQTKSVSDSITTLIGLSKEISENGSLSLSSVEKIMSDDMLTSLRPYLNDVKTMLPIINSLIADQKQAYEDLYNEQQRLADPDAYIEASQQKQEEDENAFQNSVKKINEQVAKFKEKYDVDLSNWEKLGDGKKELLKNTNAELLSKQLNLINDFAKYYNTDLTNFKNVAEAKIAILDKFRTTDIFNQAINMLDEFGTSRYNKYTMAARLAADKTAQAKVDKLFAESGSPLTWQDFREFLLNEDFTPKGSELLKKQLEEIVNAYTITPTTWDDMTKNIGASGGSSGSSSKEKTWFEKQYAYHNHLVNMEQETEKSYLDWLDGAYKEAYRQGIIDLDAYYKYEEEVYKGRKKLNEDSSNWFEKEYKAHQHKIKMERESQKDYLAWLEKAYKQAYNEGVITLDEYRKYQEEVYEGLRNIFKDYLSDREHEISMRENYDGEAKNIYVIYTVLMDSVQSEITKARSQGLKDTDSYIQELQSKWQGYYNSRKKIIDDLKNNAESSLKSLVDIRVKMIKDDIDKEKEAIDKKLKYLKEFYDKQKELLQDKYDEEKYLEEQQEKRKSVSDIQAEIEQLRYDNSAKGKKRKLELKEELEKAQKELNDFEKEHVLKEAQDKLDELYEAQEKTLNKQTEALEERENNSKALYDQALADIQNGSITLYNNMIKWNDLYGDGIRTTITNAWEEAYKALKKYSDFYGTNYKGVSLVNATGYTGFNRTWNGMPVSGYASGTSNATKGLHLIDEDGTETIFESADGSRYKLFTGGEKVLNAQASDFLYNFATKGASVLKGVFDNSYTSGANKLRFGFGNTEIKLGDIIVQGNADKTTVSEIRRAQRESLDYMLKQLNRLK